MLCLKRNILSKHGNRSGNQRSDMQIYRKNTKIVTFSKRDPRIVTGGVAGNYWLSKKTKILDPGLTEALSNTKNIEKHQ